MRDMRDWLVPITVGVLLALGIVVLGDALGWSRGAQGVGELVGVAIGVSLRFFMHDYDAAEERRRRAITS